MRLSFWLGGIAGAAAAIYLTKGNRRPMVMSTMTSAGQSLGKMFNNAKSAVADRMESKNQNASNSAMHYPYGQSGLNEVSQFANQDAGVKAEVNAILADNHQKSAYSPSQVR